MTSSSFMSTNLVENEEVMLEGEIASTSPLTSLKTGFGDTLDEPVSETFMRDVRAVATKFTHIVTFKHNKNALLRDWDLWGPLILCTLMAIVLQTESDDDDLENGGGPEFAQVFVVVWLGSLVVTINNKLIGGHLALFQSICVLGYCLLPLCLSLMCCQLLLWLWPSQTTLLFLVRFALVFMAFVWSCLAATNFLSDSVPEKRTALAAYPMCLFYFLVAWMVISHSE